MKVMQAAWTGLGAAIKGGIGVSLSLRRNRHPGPTTPLIIALYKRLQAKSLHSYWIYDVCNIAIY
jgi:hypothetical protein